MNYSEIKRLVKLVESSGIGELELEIDGARIRIAKQSTQFQSIVPTTVATAPQPSSVQAAGPPPPQAHPAEEDVTRLAVVKSPMVGTFYRAPSPEAPAYVKIGDHIRTGQVLCIIEAMKLMNEIEAEISGYIVEICVENAQPVEFGQVLFRIEPD